MPAGPVPFFFRAKVTRSGGRGEVRAERGSRLNLKETGSFLSGEHGTESSLSRLTAPRSPCLRSERNSIRTWHLPLTSMSQNATAFTSPWTTRLTHTFSSGLLASEPPMPTQNCKTGILHHTTLHNRHSYQEKKTLKTYLLSYTGHLVQGTFFSLSVSSLSVSFPVIIF